MIDARGELAFGDRLSELIGERMVYIYRWVPSYAESSIRSGDYVLLDPDEGRHYGGRNAKRLTARVSSRVLEYRQGNEYLYRGELRRAHVD